MSIGIATAPSAIAQDDPDSPSDADLMPTACTPRTVEGMGTHPLARADLAEARTAWIRSCGLAVRDCDPLPNNEGWICSGMVIGANAPGGLREGEVSGYLPSQPSGSGSADWQNQGAVGGNDSNFVGGGGTGSGSTIQFPGNSSAGLIRSGDLLALHYDNCPDPDDGHAMASAVAMIATYGLNNVVVVNGTCGNTIKNLFDDDSKRVANAIFPSHLDADANWDASVGTAAARWSSTLQSGNKVWVAEGGPSDFTADVVRRLATNSSLNLENITVVQHAHGPSSWNEGKTDGSNLAYVKRVTNYVTVANGNAANATANLNNQSNFFVNAALNSDYATEWQVAFNYLPPSRKLDFSDTVELLYLVNDTTTKTVDQFANRYIIPTRPTGTVITDNLGGSIDGPVATNNNGVIIMEAEDATLTEGWELRNSVAGHTGRGYIQWVGQNRFFEREARQGNVYTFTLERGGNYEFRFRSRIMQGSNATEHNDTWVSFPTGRNVAGEEPLQGYTKAYMGPLNQWSWVTATVDGQGKKLRQYFGPGTHTVVLSGRSTGHAVDRIALYEYGRVSFNASAFDSLTPASSDTGSFSVATTEERQVLDDQAILSAGNSTDVSTVELQTSDQIDPNDTPVVEIAANVEDGQPQYLLPFVDTDGFITTRITDYKAFETTAGQSIHSTSRRQVWSSESTMMLVGGRIIDSETKKIISPKIIPDEAIWSEDDEATLFYLDSNNTFVKYDAANDEMESLFSLPHLDGLCTFGNGQGNVARSSRIVVLSCLLDTEGTHRLYSVDLGVSERPLIAAHTSMPDMLWASVSPTGQYIVAEYNDQQGGAKRLQRYSIDFSKTALLTREPNGGDFAFDSNGQEVYAMIGDDTFSYIRLDDGQEVILDAGFAPGFGTLSCQTQDRQTCFYSTYSTNQIGTITIPTVPRQGDTRTVITTGTTLEPWGNHNATSSSNTNQARGVISRDGGSAVFVTDRGGAATAETYLIQKITADGVAQNQAFAAATESLQGTVGLDILTRDE